MTKRIPFALPNFVAQRRTIYLAAGFMLALLLVSLTANVWSGNSSVRGTVYLDANHNGMRDAGEMGVPNVYVRVGVFSEAWSQEFYTGDDGTFAPVAMSAGDYYIRLTVPDCYMPTTTTEHGVWLMDDQVILGLDFGIAPLPHCGDKPAHYDKDGASMMQGGMMAPTYTVQEGDTIDSIAEMHRVSIASLMELNGLTDPNQIYVGLVLQIPGPGMMSDNQAAAPQPQPQAAAPQAEPQPQAAVPQPQPQAAAPQAEPQQAAVPQAEPQQAAVETPGHGVYVVQAGDYLGKIAQAYDTTVGSIATANNIVDVNLLYVGQQLVIP